MKTFPKKSLTIFLLLALINGFNASSPASTTASQKVQPVTSTSKSTQDKNAISKDWLIVPVFYATNRQSLETKGILSYSEKANSKGLLFGVKNYAVPLPHNSPVDHAAQVKMQWQRIHVQVKKHSDTPEFDKTKCIVQDKVLSRDEIVPAFDTYRKNVGSPENIIYVHGCCASFDTVMSRAAMVASHTQVPVLVYDWVSPHGFINYLVNETMITQTVDDFCKFISKVETLMDPKEITFIGHSMGAQLVDHAMVRRADLMKANPSMSKFKELIMANADVDVLSFIKHGNDFALNGEKTRIYFSTKDKRLRLSRFVHGGFDRLGAPGPSISELVKIKDTECIDITENNTGHDLPYWVVANMHKYNNVGPARGFELKKLAPGYLLLVRSSIAYQEINEAPLKCVCAPRVIQ